MACVSSPFYDITQTFEENFRHPPCLSTYSSRRFCPSPSSSRVRFLEFSLASRIGVAACAATTGVGIVQLAQLGFDVLTYKTIRCRTQAAYPLPNIVHVECNKLLDYSDLNQSLFVRDPSHAITPEKIAISNSFGNACLEPSVVMQDIAFAKHSLRKDQILVVSVYGEGDTYKTIAKDFAKTACFAREAGADVIELNFSCPNLLKQKEFLYEDLEGMYAIASYVVQQNREVPILLKLGLLPACHSLCALLESVARAGIRGITAINSVSMRVLDRQQQPAFGQRIYSGISGYPIRKLALNFIKRLVQINQKEKLDLVILGVGGITLPEHFNEFFNAGADIALSASGMMWNPQLALQYHKIPL